MQCGELRLHSGHGLCNRCWQSHPDRPFVYSRGLSARLENPPEWLEGFAAYAASRFCPGRSVHMLHDLRRLLSSGARSPATLLDNARLPGRSPGSLARMLEGFFTEAGLALRMDQAERLARDRRKRRVDAVPKAFRDAVAAFAQAQIDLRTRHRKAGVRPESDSTTEERLAVLRDFACYLVEQRPAVTGWEVVAREDVEAFLGTGPEPRRKRLSVLRKYFKWARSRRVVLVDPTRELSSKSAKGFKSPVVDQDRQRALIKRWTTEAVHPHEAFVDLSALLHAASSTELRNLRVTDIDLSARTLPTVRTPPILCTAGPGDVGGASNLSQPPRGSSNFEPTCNRHKDHIDGRPTSLHRLFAACPRRRGSDAEISSLDETCKARTHDGSQTGR